VKQISEFRAMRVLGYLNRVLYLIFYVATIIIIYGENTVGELGIGFTDTIYGLVLVILGFVGFFLSFIKEMYKYYKDKMF
jgi:hypothetical protein